MAVDGDERELRRDEKRRRGNQTGNAEKSEGSVYRFTLRATTPS